MQIRNGATVLTAVLALAACGVSEVTPVKVEQSGDGKKASYEVETPDGAVKMDVDTSGAADALKELGIPLPPGAQAADSDSVMTMKTPQGTMSTVSFTVASSVKEVAAFYEKQYTLDVSMITADGGSLIAHPADKRTLTIYISGDVEDGRRTVTLQVTDEK